MSEKKHDEDREPEPEQEEGGHWAVPGRESHEDEETLSEDERGEPLRPPHYVDPVEP
jgi:hypothetical protein